MKTLKEREMEDAAQAWIEHCRTEPFINLSEERLTVLLRRTFIAGYVAGREDGRVE